MMQYAVGMRVYYGPSDHWATIMEVSEDGKRVRLDTRAGWVGVEHVATDAEMADSCDA